MSQPAPPATLTATPAQRLDQAEQQAEEELVAVIAAAVAAGLTGTALLAAVPALTNVLNKAANAGWTIGSQIVLGAAVGWRPRSHTFTPEPLPTSVEQDVLAVVEDVAKRIDAALAGEPPASEQAPVTLTPAAVEFDRFRRRMARLAVVKIHQATSAATFSYARWLGLDLEWVTRRDGKACVVCTRMNGRRAAAGERFTVPRGRGIPRKLWAGFQGLPPSHPNCRCRCVARNPRPT
ncbi:hypothetical protein [Nocardiopsis sp. NRRL B-16309]|uniref:hypothetical protein n=1 Tax=Nocardiopsis sp. NRRL B-16309 TaxID=1519494 RepID=UPI0006AE867B|nr:hypothetical protein [Nocardiopsis sp. NRRL B-16309]KOX10157.1 hypothetical protein ADL05_26135 [Nocardiopsis sp. NRRL B-16309]